MRTITTTVHALHRLNNSVNGNPRYDIHTSDGVFRTQSDAAFVYGIGNDGGPAGKRCVLSLTRAGRVWNLQVTDHE